MKPPAPVFRFLWIGNRGPSVREFEDCKALARYVQQARAVCGFDAITFRSPLLCVGIPS